jgi:hypothetical protein
LTLSGHARKNRNCAIDVVVNGDLILALMVAMKPTHVLGKGTFPRNGHCEEQRIQTSIVKAFSQIAAGGEDEAFLVN